MCLCLCLCGYVCVRAYLDEKLIHLFIKLPPTEFSRRSPGKGSVLSVYISRLIDTKTRRLVSAFYENHIYIYIYIYIYMYIYIYIYEYVYIYIYIYIKLFQNNATVFNNLYLNNVLRWFKLQNNAKCTYKSIVIYFHVIYIYIRVERWCYSLKNIFKIIK